MRRELHTAIHYPGSTPAFTPVPPEIRDRIRSLPPSRETLRWAEGQVEALQEAEMHNPTFSAPPPPTIRIAAWNAEQCRFPREAADMFSRAGIDIALLSGMDIGLNRSGQHHTLALASELLATSTGIPRGYGAGVEFYELSPEDNPATPESRVEENLTGYHANGWVTRFKARRPALIRLQPEADWFVNPRRGLRRVGSRLGFAAIFELGNFELVAASVNLEPATDAAGRRRQMRHLLDGLKEYAAERPIVIGGDFNTGAGHPDWDIHAEGLFREAERCGYEWDNANTREPTWRAQDQPAQATARLDWFFTKNIRAMDPAVIPAVDRDNVRLSNHDAIAISLPLPKDA